MFAAAHGLHTIWTTAGSSRVQELVLSHETLFSAPRSVFHSWCNCGWRPKGLVRLELVARKLCRQHGAKEWCTLLCSPLRCWLCRPPAAQPLHGGSHRHGSVAAGLYVQAHACQATISTRHRRCRWLKWCSTWSQRSRPPIDQQRGNEDCELVATLPPGVRHLRGGPGSCFLRSKAWKARGTWTPGASQSRAKPTAAEGR